MRKLLEVLISRTIASVLDRSPDLRRMVENRLEHVDLVRRLAADRTADDEPVTRPIPHRVPDSPTLRAMIGPDCGCRACKRAYLVN